jgi:hypothetical protein
MSLVFRINNLGRKIMNQFNDLNIEEWMARLRDTSITRSIDIESKKPKPKQLFCEYCKKDMGLIEPLFLDSSSKWVFRGAGIKPSLNAGTLYCTCDVCRDKQLEEEIDEQIPMRYRAGYDENMAKEDMELSKQKDGVIYTGITGNGKTTRMYNLFKYLYRETNGDVAFFNVSSLIAECRKDAGVFLNSTIEIAQNAKYLFLDDIRVDNLTEFVIDKLYEIINYRYENMMSLFCSTNLNTEEMDKHFPRITSRILQMCVIKKLGDKDMRRIKNVK